MARTLRLNNVIYIPHINIIGGVETWIYEMGIKYGKDYDLTLLYEYGDPKQLAHIASVVRVIRLKPDDLIVCDVFLFGWGWSEQLFKRITAKDIIQTFHADYIARDLKPCIDPKVTKRFGVSDNTTKGVLKNFDWAQNTKTMRNPYTIKKPRKVLNLVSATRLTPEKGYERMIKLCEALDKADIPFVWLVFTDQPKPSPHPSVAVLNCKVEGILDYIANADYLVQLSDTEGFSYTIVEALSVGTPCIVTAFPVAQENGVIHGKTGWILPFDMSEIPVKEIYKGLPKFKWEPPESHYEEVLKKGKSKYEQEMKKIVKVRSKIHFIDIEASKAEDREVHRYPNDEWEVTRFRADRLEELDFAEIVEE